MLAQVKRHATAPALAYAPARTAPMRCYPMDYQTIARRYPHLLRAMKWAGCLSSFETVSAIYAWQCGHHTAGEGVSHAGGTAVLIRDAVRWRHHVRRINRRAAARLFL